MDTYHKRSIQGAGLSLSYTADCIFNFDEEYENPTIFTKHDPKPPRETFDLEELDRDTFLNSPNLFFNRRMLRS